MKSVLKQQRGDTIVEVLIAMAIISLVLTVSYSTANKNYLRMIDAQEHANALKLAERQIELLKEYGDSTGGHGVLFPTPPSNFCMLDATTTAPNAAPNNKCLLNSDSTTAALTAEPAYSVTINQQPPTPQIKSGGELFKVQITWDSIVNDSKNTVQTEYSVY